MEAELQQPTSAAETIAPAASPRLGAGRAFAMLVLVFVAQALFGIAMVIVGIIVAVIRDVNFEDKRQFARVMEPLNAPVLLLSVLVSAAVLYFLVRAWVPSWFTDRSATGFGPARLSSRRVVAAAVYGLAIGAAYCVLLNFVFAPPSPSQLGPLAQVANRPGMARATLAVIAVFFAPLFEEVFFRGLLFKGFAESWGYVSAGVIVTVLFVLTHVFEFAHYWPAALAILTLAIATLIARLKTGSVASAILLHAGYNLAVMVSIYLGKPA